MFQDISKYLTQVTVFSITYTTPKPILATILMSKNDIIYIIGNAGFRRFKRRISFARLYKLNPLVHTAARTVNSGGVHQGVNITNFVSLCKIDQVCLE